MFNPFYVVVPSGRAHQERPRTAGCRSELTLVNDLPVNVTPSQSRQPLGGAPPVMAYFLDDNAYTARASEWFWVRGESRAECMLRAPVVMEVSATGRRWRGRCGCRGSKCSSRPGRSPIA